MDGGSPGNVHPIVFRNAVDAPQRHDQRLVDDRRMVIAGIYIVSFLGVIISPALIGTISLSLGAFDPVCEDDCYYHKITSFTCPTEVDYLGCCNEHWA